MEIAVPYIKRVGTAFVSKSKQKFNTFRCKKNPIHFFEIYDYFITVTRDIQSRAFQDLLELHNHKKGGKKIYCEISRILDMHGKLGYGDLDDVMT